MLILSWLLVGLFFMLMVSGNIISSTLNGFTCPDWPLCFITFSAALGQATSGETVHRILAVTALILVSGVLHQIVGRKNSQLGGNPQLKKLGQAIVLLLGGQFGLGIAMMFLGFSPVASTIHFLFASLVFSGLIVIACTVTWGFPVVQNLPSNAQGNGQSKIQRLAIFGLGGVAVQLLLGALVRHTHAGLSCPNFPACGTNFLPDLFTFKSTLAFMHRWWGVLILGLFFHLAMAARGTGLTVARLAAAAFALSLTQILLGIVTVMGGLNVEARALHAAVAYTLWGILLSIAVRAGALKFNTAAREP